MIRSRWKAVVMEGLRCPEDNHFTILDRLADPDSALFKGAMKGPLEPGAAAPKSCSRGMTVNVTGRPLPWGGGGRSAS